MSFSEMDALNRKIAEKMKSDLIQRAMEFAHKAHATQVRKYTNAPYTSHLAEVADIVASIGGSDEQIAVAWLHDTIEDQGVKPEEIEQLFGQTVRLGVELLSDLETGNRRTRKMLSRQRLAAAPDWVQTVKVADLISNTSSIMDHDPKFAVVYLEEKRLLLDVLTKADSRLLEIARKHANGSPLQNDPPEETWAKRPSNGPGRP